MFCITEFYFYKLHFINCLLRKIFFFRVFLHLKYNFFVYIYDIYKFLKLYDLKNFFFFNFRFIYRKLKKNLKKNKLYQKCRFFFLFRKKKINLNTVLKSKKINLFFIFFLKFFIFFK